jgi:multidrug resistance efflux pump
VTLKKIIGFILTLTVFAIAIFGGQALWIHYEDSPWTRDGRVRADIVTVSPDVSGLVVGLPVRDNQLVRRGDLLMQIDPSRFQLAVEQAKAQLAASQAELAMRRRDAARRADLDALVVSTEIRENATLTASAAAAQVQAALAQLDTAKLNLERTRVLSPVDGYVTNLLVQRGDYASTGKPQLAVIDRNSFWVYGYFEETKLPYISVGDTADMRLMSGLRFKGHVDSIARGVTDRDNPSGPGLISDVNPTFNWVRLAQRVPVRIHIDESSIPRNVVLAAGTTCTIVIEQAEMTTAKGASQSTDSPKTLARP